MLSSLLYRMRRSALRKPLNLILLLIALGLMGVMINYSEIAYVWGKAYDPDMAVGVMRILAYVIFNIVASGMVNGTIAGYTLPDVNFHLAGPFTPKFNKLIALINTCKSGLVMVFVLCSQAALLSEIASFKRFDMIFMLFVVFYVTVAASCVTNIVSPYACDDESDRNKNIVTAVFAGVNIIVVLNAVIDLIREAGSFGAISSLSTSTIISTIGNSFCMRYFPFSGFITTLYAGIVTKDAITIVIGIALTILGIIVLAVLFDKLDAEYYEAATASALKMQDFIEAKKAGIDTDAAKINRSVKVGKEELNKGWGVNTFMFCKMFEYQRQTKFFFINPLAIIYRILILVYMFLIFGRGNQAEGMDPFEMSLIMNICLNVIVYSGGKTVLEFNRPYFFLAPYSSVRKLFYSIMGEFPCMIFDSALCVVTTAYFTGFEAYSVITWILLFVVMFIMAIAFTMLAILGIRLFRGLGRYALMITRYLAAYAFIIIALVISAVVMSALDAGIEIGLLTFALISLIAAAGIFAMSPIIVNNVEN